MAPALAIFNFLKHFEALGSSLDNQFSLHLTPSVVETRSCACSVQEYTSLGISIDSFSLTKLPSQFECRPPLQLMPPRHTACCRALQRPNQALPSSESIWISDALLFNTFQRFLVNSNGARRHGSFVPGPLESRRRLGKRRMAYRTDAGTPMFGAGEPFLWMGDIKELSQRWQAPTTSITRAAKVEFIPRWLALWPYPPDTPMTTELETAAGWLPEEATWGRDKLLDFQQDLSETNVDKIAICSKFNQHLKQSIIIGSVNEDIICDSIVIVTDEINSACDDERTADARKLAFYQAVWQGMSSCQVIPLDTLRATTMDQLLEKISALPVSVSMRTLARDVLSTVSESQLGGMDRSIQSLTNSWLFSWAAIDNQMFDMQSVDALMLNAKAAVEATHSALWSTEDKFVSTWESEGTFDLENAQQVVAELRKEMHIALQAIKKCEALFYPVRSSIVDLAHTLHRVAPSALGSIVESCTHNIIQRYSRPTEPTHKTNIRISFLHLVSQLPNASRALFVQTWRAFDTQRSHWHVAENLGCDLILSHMISQGFIKDPAWLKNIFEASSDGPTLKEYGFLLTSLYNQDKDWSGPLYLVQLLAVLNQPRAIYKAINRAKVSGLRPPVDMMRSLLSSIAVVNSRIAYNIYNLCVPHMYSWEEMDLSLCPDYVISMIHDNKMAPRVIWRVLGVPSYEPAKTASRYRRSCELSGRKCIGWISRKADRRRRFYIPPPPLSPTWIALITDMASAFSVSEARPQRVAFRNVSQCLYHLRRHGVPISPDISRALSYAGITREILRENWISEERLAWILRIVAAGEGQVVRDTVEATVELWWKEMEQLSLARRHMRLNPGANPESVFSQTPKPTVPNKEESLTLKAQHEMEFNGVVEMATYTPLTSLNSQEENLVHQIPSSPAALQRILQESTMAMQSGRVEVPEKQMIVSPHFEAYVPGTPLPNIEEDGAHEDRHEIESTEVVKIATHPPLAPVSAQVKNRPHRMPPSPATLQLILQDSKLAMQNGQMDRLAQQFSVSPPATLQRARQELKSVVKIKRDE